MLIRNTSNKSKRKFRRELRDFIKASIASMFLKDDEKRKRRKIRCVKKRFMKRAADF